MFGVPKIFQRFRGRYDFENASERESKIQIKSKKLIGAGFNGEVYRARIEVLGKGGRRQVETFVLKDFEIPPAYGEEPRDVISRRETIERALRAHKKLKELGIRTWATYRSEDSWRYILMTDGEMREGDKVITFNDPSNSKFEIRGTITDFSNFDEAITIAVRETVTAAQNGQEINSHAWMWRIRPAPDSTATITVFAGDLDNVTPFSGPRVKNAEEAIRSNLKALRTACIGMARDTLKEGNDQEVIRGYEERIDALLASAGGVSP